MRKTRDLRAKLLEELRHQAVAHALQAYATNQRLHTQSPEA